MDLSITAIFYGLIGAGVSAALLLSDVAMPRGERGFRGVTAVLFWPLYLPLLLRPAIRSESATHLPQVARTSNPDELATMIDHVENELGIALRNLADWSDQALLPERERLSELQTAWRSQAERIRELDELLAQPTFVESVSAPDTGSVGQVFNLPLSDGQVKNLPHLAERVAHSERARQQNLARLRAVRQRMHADLVGTLAWVRELVTMIHLAKYTGAPASRAADLVAQIATAVEGLSEVSAWEADSIPTRETDESDLSHAYIH